MSKSCLGRKLFARARSLPFLRRKPTVLDELEEKEAGEVFLGELDEDGTNEKDLRCS